MGRSHAAPAVHGDPPTRSDPESGESCAELVDREEAPVGIHVLRGGGADRPGDVPGDAIDRLVFTAETLGGSGVEKDVHPTGVDVVGVDGWHRVPIAGRESCTGWQCRLDGGHHAAGGSPRGQPAVQEVDTPQADPTE